jgi:hypothetical protein
MLWCDFYKLLDNFMKNIGAILFLGRFLAAASTLLFIGACAEIPWKYEAKKVYSLSDWVPNLEPKPPPLPMAKPQVVYRIDENRYFEIVPRGPAACEKALVYYVDKKLEIYSYVIPYDAKTMNGRKFRIDAANDKYLGAPTSRFNIGCTGKDNQYCGDLITAFSIDFGRKWEFVNMLGIGDQTITENFYFDTGALHKSVEFRSEEQIKDGKFFDMTTPYKYYFNVWIPTNQNTINPNWEIDDYPGRRGFTDPSKLAFFSSEDAPKIAKLPPLRKQPIDDEFKCTEISPVTTTVKKQ